MGSGAGNSPSNASMQSSTCASFKSESKDMSPLVSNRLMDAADTPDMADKVSRDRLRETRRARACCDTCRETSLGDLNDNILFLIVDI